MAMETGNDNDTLNISSIWGSFTGTIDAGSGNDVVTINGINNNGGNVNGGTGTDTLNLNNYTVADWNNWLSDNFTGFETVNLKDGVVNP